MGERAAARLLRRSGYRIEDAQRRVTWRLAVDGEPCTVELRADYIVSRAGLRWVAEVKTGPNATKLSHGPTRRQLLEYGLAFDVDGVLLVSPEQGRIQEVRFPDAGGSHGFPSRALLLAFAAGALSGGLSLALLLGR